MACMHRRILAAALAVAFLGAVGTPHRAGRTARPNPTPRAGESPRAKLPVRPKAPKHTVTDTYWGVTVPDDYRYMEGAHDAATETWARGQDRYTRAWMAAHPERKAILDRVESLTHSESPDYYGGSYSGGTYFFLKEQP